MKSRTSGVRFGILVCCGIMLLLGRSVGAGQTITTSLKLSEWGILRAGEIRYGQVSVYRDGQAPSLSIGRLGVQEPPGFAENSRSMRPGNGNPRVQVADLSGEPLNAFGGAYGVFERRPSRANAEYVGRVEGRRLQVRYAKKPGSFCGLWVQLFDAFAGRPERVLCDATGFECLTFWIRGDCGGEKVSLRLADARAEFKGDSYFLADAGSSTPTGKISTVWQRAIVPLSRPDPKVDLKSLALLVFQFDKEDSSAIELRSISLCSKSPPPETLEWKSTAARIQEGGEMALWVWNTDSLLADPREAEDFVAFVSSNAFNRIYLSIPVFTARKNISSVLEKDRDRFLPLLERLSRSGIRTEALFGEKEFARPARHNDVLQLIGEVVRYNYGVEPSQRFSGIHLDVEPYLLPGFFGDHHDSIVTGYLNLLATSRRVCTAGGLALAVDVPFWYDLPDERTGENLFSHRHGHGPLIPQILDQVDMLVIMDYRTAVYGADGIVHHAVNELAEATARGKPVLIGLETGLLPVEESYVFQGGESSSPPGRPFLAMIPDGDSVHLVFAGDGGEDDPSGILRKLKDGDALYWRLRLETIVPPEKLSFATLGQKELLRAMERARAETSVYPSFRGLALHHYSSVRRLLDR